jgi:lipid-A-disaccharide synthase
MEIPVCYFISPQIWAWRQSRVKQIRRNVDLMLVILPFEEGYYRSHGVEAHYVGNPTANRFRRLLKSSEAENGSGRSTIALLPGSRCKEIDLILPVQLDAVAYLSEHLKVEAVIARAPAIDASYLQDRIERWKVQKSSSLKIKTREESWKVLRNADCAVVKSGTSTLEAMLAGVPFAMVYRISPVSYALLKPFVKTDTFCLANLVAGRKIAPEFIQNEARGEPIGRFLLDLLSRPEKYLRTREILIQASGSLGNLDAAKEASRIIHERFFNLRDR